jgi:hypothetical protein
VTLENGSRFKGSIDMEGAGTEEKPVAQSSVSGRPDGGESTSARPDTASKPTSEGSKAADKATAAGAG